MAADTVTQGEIKALLEEGDELSCLELSRNRLAVAGELEAIASAA
jgi:hypothetical protein